MRNRTLTQLVEDLRLETGRSPNANLGIADKPALVRILTRNYETYYNDYNWPHLKVRRDKELAAGQRYYDFPVDIDPERILTVERRWSGTWTPIERGITMDDYNSYDSDDSDVRSDPVLKWDMHDTSALSAAHQFQMEVWPLPATSYDSDSGDGKIRLTAIRKFTALVNDSDVCLIDGNVVVLVSAAELLAKSNKADAAAKLSAATKILRNVEKNLSHKSPNKFNMNSGGSCYPGTKTGERILVSQVVREE